MKRYKVLLIHDVEIASREQTIRWAYAHRTAALQKYAPDDFDVDRCSDKGIRWNKIRQYDLVFSLDYMLAPAYWRNFKKYGWPTRFVTSFNKDSNSRNELYPRTLKSCDWVIINNRDRYLAGGISKRTSCISNGVDCEDWYVTTPIEEREDKLLWCGSTGPAKRKGYHEVIRYLKGYLIDHGFKCDVRPIDTFDFKHVWPTDKQREWYNSGSYYLNLSETEGTPSAALESMACGCIYISVPIGNVLEFGSDGVNYVHCDRRRESVLSALKIARDNKAMLSRNGRDTMDHWSYGRLGQREQYFYALFRSLIDAPSELRSWSYEDFTVEDIHAAGGYIHEVLKKQDAKR